ELTRTSKECRTRCPSGQSIRSAEDSALITGTSGVLLASRLRSPDALFATEECAQNMLDSSALLITPGTHSARLRRGSSFQVEEFQGFRRFGANTDPRTSQDSSPRPAPARHPLKES